MTSVSLTLVFFWKIEDRRRKIPGVDIYHPPKTIYFKFYPGGISPLEDVQNDRNQPLITQPTGTIPGSSIQEQSTSIQRPGINPASTSVNTISSITNRDHRLFQSRFCGVFEDYLTFSGINPGDRVTRVKLSKNGFDHWFDLRENPHVNVSSLVKLDITLATAQKLVDGADRYSDRVKANILNGVFETIEC